MTTDPFTTADDRWDESPHHLADHCEHAGVGKACRRCRRKFDAASQWARDYLAAQEDDGHDGWCGCGCQDAQEPTDAEVEAAARGLYENRVAQVETGWERRYWPEWDDHEQADADEWRDAARAALTAARAARRDEVAR